MRDSSRIIEDSQVNYRGFVGYGALECTYGTTVRVYESSSAELDAVWLCLDGKPTSQGGVVGPQTNRGEAVAHLDYRGAVWLIEKLQRWCDEHVPEQTRVVPEDAAQRLARVVQEKAADLGEGSVDLHKAIMSEIGGWPSVAGLHENCW